MSKAHARIVVADGPTPWRNELVKGLEEAGARVRITELGQELRLALEETEKPPRLVVIGQNLKGIGGLEALYLAERTLRLEGRRRPEWPTRTVSLVTDVRSDAELMDLLRRRGVNQFVYRDEALDKTIATLNACLRRSERVMVRIDATVKLGEICADGAVYDLSATGAKVVVSMRRLGVTPAVGEKIELQLSFRRQVFTWQAEIRRLARNPGSMGDRAVLGVQFVLEDEAMQEALEGLLRDAAEEFDVMRLA